MKCPKCGKDVELIKKQVSVDDNGEPVLNEFAVCHDCKKKWNLDKQRKKKVGAITPDDSLPQEVEIKTEEPQYSNIPPKKVRKKSEKAVKKNYEDMLSIDADNRRTPKSKPASKSKSSKAYKKEPPKPKFKVLRVILGVISIIGAIYFGIQGVFAGLDNIASGGQVNTGTAYIVLALCVLVSGLIALLLQNRRTVFAFILPVLFYIGGGVFSFIYRQSDSILLYGSIASVVFAVIYIILLAASRKKHSDDEYDDEY